MMSDYPEASDQRSSTQILQFETGRRRQYPPAQVGASYIDTNAKADCGGTSQFYCFTNSNADNGSGVINTGSKSRDAGRGVAVLSVSRTF